MGRAMERHSAGEARVVPVILKPCDWQDAPFARLQALPRDARPVVLWTNRDEAFLDVAQGIRRAVAELRAARGGAAPNPPVPPAAPTRPPPTPAEAVSETWRDVDQPGNVSYITRRGDSFTFTRRGILPNGFPFESSGTGRYDGQRVSTEYLARYASGFTSQGTCTGTVSADGTR